MNRKIFDCDFLQALKGRNTYRLEETVCWKTVVSTNELQSIMEWTLGLLKVCSANFCAKKPPREAPNM